jgi:hypothetical protein
MSSQLSRQTSEERNKERIKNRLDEIEKHKIAFRLSQDAIIKSELARLPSYEREMKKWKERKQKRQKQIDEDKMLVGTAAIIGDVSFDPHNASIEAKKLEESLRKKSELDKIQKQIDEGKMVVGTTSIIGDVSFDPHNASIEEIMAPIRLKNIKQREATLKSHGNLFSTTRNGKGKGRKNKKTKKTNKKRKMKTHKKKKQRKNKNTRKK